MPAQIGSGILQKTVNLVTIAKRLPHQERRKTNLCLLEAPNRAHFERMNAALAPWPGSPLGVWTR